MAQETCVLVKNISTQVAHTNKEGYHLPFGDGSVLGVIVLFDPGGQAAASAAGAHVTLFATRTVSC